MPDDNSFQLLWEILPRILCATFCGALIGLERDIHGRAAGLRTHTLVASGSALFTVVSIMVAAEGNLSLQLATSDPGRIAAQVVSGIGFLGAGTIVKAGLSVKGLTTAACLWFVAALGMACGIDQCPTALAVTFIGLTIIFSGKRIEKKILRKVTFNITAETQDLTLMNPLKNYFEQTWKYTVNSINVTYNGTSIRATFLLESHRPHKHSEACIKLVSQLRQEFPQLTLIAYKNEG